MFYSFLLCGKTEEACSVAKSLRKVYFSHPTGRYVWKFLLGPSPWENPGCAPESITFIHYAFGKLQYSTYHNQGCGAVTFLVGSGSGSGSGEAFRLRLRVKLYGGSGSGQNVPAPAPAPMLKSSYEPYLTSNTIFKNVKYQNMTSYWLDLEFECYFEWVPLKFVTHCHPRSVADTGEVTNSNWGCTVRNKWITA